MYELKERAIGNLWYMKVDGKLIGQHAQMNLFSLPLGLQEAAHSTVCDWDAGPDPGQNAVWGRGRCQHSGQCSRLLCGRIIIFLDACVQCSLEKEFQFNSWQLSFKV